MSDTAEKHANEAEELPVVNACATCSLDCIVKGEHIEIVSVDDKKARVQALRFGMAEGAHVECVTKIPAGPLVIKSGRQEIAVGRALAKRINVRRLA
jgi:ferrous iron transport protein A